MSLPSSDPSAVPLVDLFGEDDDSFGEDDDSGFFFEDSTSELSAALTQQNLIDTQERIGQLLDLLPMGLVIHQQQGILFANRCISEMLGVPAEGLVGQHLLDFIIDHEVDAVTAIFGEVFRQKHPCQLPEVRLAGKNGREWTIELIMGPLPWEGTPCIQVLLHDITALKEQEHALRELATTDPLTGALNRRSFEERANFELRRSHRYRRPCCIVLIDIDHFKAVNDNYGHHAGDMAIQKVVQIAKQCLRTSDSLGMVSEDEVVTSDTGSLMPIELVHREPEVSRMGGEEFLMLLPETELTGALSVANRIRETIEATLIEADAHRFKVTASFGVAELRRDDNLVSFTQRADQGLYEAKATGRNRVCVGGTQKISRGFGA